MERKEATALLRELVNANLVQPSLVSFRKNAEGHFDLVIKTECDPIEIRRFMDAKDYPFLVDYDKGICRTYKRS